MVLDASVPGVATSEYINNLHSFERKWSPRIAQHGHTAVPNLLVQNLEQLKITTPEFVTLVAIISFKWDESNPWPSNATIAKRANTTASTVRKHVQKLEEKGILDRIGRVGYTNMYDLTPLMAKLEGLAELPSPIGQGSLPAPIDITRGGEAILTPEEDSVEKDVLIKHTNKSAVAKATVEPPEVRLAYDYYIECFGNNPNQYKLTPKRKTKIKSRLKDAGFEMLKRAIENTSQSDFHMGDNQRGWKADLDYIVQSYENVEKLAHMADKTVTYKADW